MWLFIKLFSGLPYENGACRAGGHYKDYNYHYAGALFLSHSHGNSFEDRVPVDFIYGYPIFK